MKNVSNNEAKPYEILAYVHRNNSELVGYDVKVEQEIIPIFINDEYWPGILDKETKRFKGWYYNTVFEITENEEERGVISALDKLKEFVGLGLVENAFLDAKRNVYMIEPEYRQETIEETNKNIGEENLKLQSKQRKALVMGAEIVHPKYILNKELYYYDKSGNDVCCSLTPYGKELLYLNYPLQVPLIHYKGEVVTSYKGMFGGLNNGMYKYKIDVSRLHCYYITDMSYMFAFSKFGELMGMDNIVTDRVRNMDGMFMYSNIENINFGHIDTDSLKTAKDFWRNAKVDKSENKSMFTNKVGSQIELGECSNV